MAFPSAIGCIVIGESPITSGGPCLDVEDDQLCKVIKSYLYWQFKDDDNLQAFVDSYNSLAQQFVTWFCSLNLPIYTTSPIDGALLNWVGEGLYGYPRPVLGKGAQRVRGPYNTWQLNSIQLNDRYVVSNFQAELVTDDIYRRCLTWHFFKGDGKQFNTRWLKRRIMRWLTGEDGIDPHVDQTYRVSVSYGLCCQVNVTLVRLRGRLTNGAFYNNHQLNSRQMNYFEVIVTILYPDQFELAQQLKEAIEQGVLELPFQFTYVVKIQ